MPYMDKMEIDGVSIDIMAKHAEDADHANSADNALTADYATEAGHATSADSATNATNAGHATSADSATYADEAGETKSINLQMENPNPSEVVFLNNYCNKCGNIIKINFAFSLNAQRNGAIFRFTDVNPSNEEYFLIYNLNDGTTHLGYFDNGGWFVSASNLSVSTYVAIGIMNL